MIINQENIHWILLDRFVLNHGGAVSSVPVRDPPPPPPLRAHLVTKGQWLLAIHRVAPKAPENFGDPRECRGDVAFLPSFGAQPSGAIEETGTKPPPPPPRGLRPTSTGGGESRLKVRGRPTRVLNTKYRVYYFSFLKKRHIVRFLQLGLLKVLELHLLILKYILIHEDKILTLENDKICVQLINIIKQSILTNLK